MIDKDRHGSRRHARIENEGTFQGHPIPALFSADNSPNPELAGSDAIHKRALSVGHHHRERSEWLVGRHLHHAVQDPRHMLMSKKAANGLFGHSVPIAIGHPGVMGNAVI
jgi:hypothetical protein